jgi:hypothetical protein
VRRNIGQQLVEKVVVSTNYLTTSTKKARKGCCFTLNIPTDCSRRPLRTGFVSFRREQKHANMPVFSFTAPHITPEEEKRERESLTDDLRKELERDIYGDDSDNNADVDADDVDVRLVEEMEAIIEQTPKLRKKDYLDAKERVPELIESEANPIQFLRCEKSNVSVSKMSFDSNLGEKIIFLLVVPILFSYDYFAATLSYVCIPSFLSLSSLYVLFRFRFTGRNDSHVVVLEDASEVVWRASGLFTNDPSGCLERRFGNYRIGNLGSIAKRCQGTRHLVY